MFIFMAIDWMGPSYTFIVWMTAIILPGDFTVGSQPPSLTKDSPLPGWAATF